MAQEKNMNEKPKRTRKPKAKDEALPVEQITELMPNNDYPDISNPS